MGPAAAYAQLVLHPAGAHERPPGGAGHLVGVDPGRVLRADDRERHAQAPASAGDHRQGHGRRGDGAEVASRGRLEDPGHRGGALGRRHHPGERSGEHVAGEEDPVGTAGHRVPDRDRHRRPREARQDGPQLASEMGKGRGAPGIGVAVGDHAVEGALGIPRRRQEGLHVRGGDGPEDHRPDVAGVAPEVDQGRAGPVGRPVEVDAFVAQRRAHLVEVVHGDGRGVLAQVRVRGEAVAAAPERAGGDVEGIERPGRGVGTPEVAGEAVGTAGAALVHQDDGPMTSDRRPGRRAEEGGVVACPLPGATGEIEDRIRRGVGTGRLEDDDVQGESPAASGRAILVDFVVPAAHWPRDPRDGARPQGDTVPVRRRLHRCRHRQRQEDHQGKRTFGSPEVSHHLPRPLRRPGRGGATSR